MTVTYRIEEDILYIALEGRVDASNASEAEKQIFEIKDSGEGMTADVKERIFEKFFQGDSSHSTSGNGIGLNIVQRIVTLAGGSVSVESEPHKGAKFTVYLP